MNFERWSRLAATEGARGRFSAGGGIDVPLSDDAIVLARTIVEAGAERREATRTPISASIDWTHGMRAESARRREVEKSNSDRVDWSEGRVVVALGLDDVYDELIDWDGLDPWLDGDGAPFLLVDTPRDGDRFSPLGMNGQSMALNDFFRARRVSRGDRRRSLVVRDREGIVWVVGHRIADRVRRREVTQRVVALRWERADDRPGRESND